MSGYAQTFEFSIATAAPLPLCSGEGCAIQMELVLNGPLMCSSPLIPNVAQADHPPLQGFLKSDNMVSMSGRAGAGFRRLTLSFEKKD
jgi:hypothetical protein